MLQSGGMMHKTMYGGGISQNNLTSKHPIHIKIEDQITVGPGIKNQL